MSLSKTGLRRPGQIVWLPDVALVLSLLTLFYCLFLFDGWHQLFRDSDSGWHIRTGETILTTLQLPAADPYSFTRAGERWFAWEWASDVVMAIAHRGLGGMAGVALLYAVAIAAATFLWVRLNWQLGTEFLIACLTTIPMLSTVNLHWLARPHVFGWLFLLIAAGLAARREVVVNARGIAAIAALSVVWVNMHASFFLLPAALLVFAAGDWIEHQLFDRGTEPAKAKPLAILAGVAAAASLLNPYGWNVHTHVFRYLMNSELLDRVGEFQTFNFHVAGAWQIVILMAWIALGGSLALWQGRIAHALWTGMLFALALRSARGLPIAALAAMPFASAAISAAIRAGFGFKPLWRDRLFAFIDYSQRLRQIDRGLSGLWTVAPLLLLFFAAARGVGSKAGFPADQFPVEAADAAVAKLPQDARILAPDKFGGYLIYRFNGERKVYFDGRSDFYGSAFMKNYIQLVEVRPGWQKQLDQQRFSHALLPNPYSLIPALQQLGWKTLHRDSVATLLAKEGASE